MNALSIALPVRSLAVPLLMVQIIQPLIYDGSAPMTTSSIEWPTTNDPENVTINSSVDGYITFIENSVKLMGCSQTYLVCLFW
jgi:hypothetical protein